MYFLFKRWLLTTLVLCPTLNVNKYLHCICMWPQSTQKQTKEKRNHGFQPIKQAKQPPVSGMLALGFSKTSSKWYFLFMCFINVPIKSPQVLSDVRSSHQPNYKITLFSLTNHHPTKREREGNWWRVHHQWAGLLGLWLQPLEQWKRSKTKQASADGTMCWDLSIVNTQRATTWAQFLKLTTGEWLLLLLLLILLRN